MKPSDRKGRSGAGLAFPGVVSAAPPHSSQVAPSHSYGAGTSSHDWEQSSPEKKGLLVFPPGVIAQG